MPSDEDGWEFDEREVGTADSEDDEEWDISLSDLEDDEDDHQSAVGGNVFGSASSDTEIIEPGSPSGENVAFVVLGFVLALLLFLQFYLLVG